MLRAAGIVALIVLAACGQTSGKPAATPSPIVAQGNWNQSLTFSGEITGHMATIVPDVGDRQSACTGGRTHNGETWADLFYGTVDSSGQVWGVVFKIDNFRGPGTYQGSSVAVEVHSTDATKVWLNLGTDKATFTLDRSQQSGTVDATLANATTGNDGLQITGAWNCRQ
jgi:hypothetical protein